MFKIDDVNLIGRLVVNDHNRWDHSYDDFFENLIFSVVALCLLLCPLLNLFFGCNEKTTTISFTSDSRCNSQRQDEPRAFEEV